MSVLSKYFHVITLLGLLSAATLFFGADAPIATYLFSALIVGLAGSYFLLFPEQAQLPSSFLVPVGLLAGFFALDAYLGRLSLALPEYAGLIAAGAVFLMARSIARSTERVLSFWQMLTLAMAALAFWAFVDFLISPETIFGRERPWHENRLSMTFLSANTAATWMGVCVLVALGQLLKVIIRIGLAHPVLLIEEITRKTFPAAILFTISLLCLILTASRAGLTFTLVAAALLTLWEIDAARRDAGEAIGKGLAKSLIVIATVAGIILILWSIYAEVLQSRTTEIDEDADMRAVMYAAYAGAIPSSPLIGHGLGSFEIVNNSVMTAENAPVLARQGAAHNIELQWLLQAGILGSAAMWGVVAFILGSIWRGLSTRRRLRGQLRVILCASLLVLLHSQVDYALEIPGFMWWWVLLLGLGAGIADGRATAPRRRTE